MLLRTLLLGTSLLAASPALAMIDPPAASNDDMRMRSLVYNPNNPVEIHTLPGMSLRIEFGADEEVVDGGIVVSDQDTIAPDPMAPPPAEMVSTNSLSSGPKMPPSCDANMCRSVSGNIVYIKPVRPLDPQPLFIQTQRMNAFGKREMVAYAFELVTKPVLDKDGKPLPPVWGVKFTYPDRVKQAGAAAWMRQKEKRDAEVKDLATMEHPIRAAPGAQDNVRYGYRGSASLQPDRVWDDGRTTFLRFNGNRRLPNIYNQLPNGEKSIPATRSDPDEGGNTIRVTGTEAKWFLWYGEGQEGAGCLFDLGPDPEGRNAPTVAPPAQRAGR